MKKNFLKLIFSIIALLIFCSFNVPVPQVNTSALTPKSSKINKVNKIRQINTEIDKLKLERQGILYQLKNYNNPSATVGGMKKASKKELETKLKIINQKIENLLKEKEKRKTELQKLCLKKLKQIKKEIANIEDKIFNENYSTEKELYILEGKLAHLKYIKKLLNKAFKNNTQKDYELAKEEITRYLA